MTPALVVPVLGRKLYPGASVALDFTRNLYRSGTPVVKGSPSLLSGWTFTRASTGYAETAAGALVAFASGEPRRTDKGLLVEEARTNLLLRSQEFDVDGSSNPWQHLASSVSANVTTAPDGTLTADKLVENTANSTHRIRQAYTKAASAIQYTGSVYLKAAERTRAVLQWYDSAATSGVTAAFDLSNGTVLTAAAAFGGAGWVAGTATITALADGWYRVAVPFTTSTDTMVRLDWRLISTGTTDSYTGDGTSGIYIWGAQLELGAFPTSYIPTTTASATRAADVAIITGLSIPAPFTLVAEYVKNGEGTTTDFPRALSLEGATIQHSLFQRDSTQAARVFVTSTVDLTVGTGSLGAVSKLAGRFETNNVNGAFNGAAGTADTAATVQTGISIYLGTAASADPMLGYIRRAIIYPYAFTDAQLAAATA